MRPEDTDTWRKVNTTFREASLRSTLAWAVRHRLPGSEEIAGWLAELRRDDKTPVAWPASIILAAPWPEHARYRRWFCEELLEHVEENLDLPLGDVIPGLLGARDKFAAAAGDLAAVARLIAAAAAPLGYRAVAIASADRIAVQRSVGLACEALVDPIARLWAAARARIRDYPLGARTRGVLIESGAGVVVTLAARFAEAGETRLGSPACSEPDVAASLRAGWNAAQCGRPVEYRLLDRDLGFGGSSLGLAAMISARNLMVAAARPARLAAIGGGVSSPFTPQRHDDLDVKLRGLHAWATCHAEGVRLLAVAGIDDPSLPAGWRDTERIPAVSLATVEEALRAPARRLGKLRTEWAESVPPAPIRRIRAEQALERHLTTQALILVTGEPNMGKSTFARDLVHAWNRTDRSGRVAHYTRLTAKLDLRAAAAALARALGHEPGERDDIGEMLRAVAGAWHRIGGRVQLVWIVDGIEPALERRAAGSLVEGVQGAQVPGGGDLAVIGIVGADAEWLDARVPRSVPRVEIGLFDDAELDQLGVETAAGGLRELVRHPWAWRDRSAGGAHAAIERLARGELAPLGFVEEMVDRRLSEVAVGAATSLHDGLGAMAAGATLSFAAASDALAALVAGNFASGVDGERARLREGWLIEHALASRLAEPWLLEDAKLSQWLEDARRAPAGDQPLLERALVGALVRLAVVNPTLGEAKRLDGLLDSADPQVVVVAVRAQLAIASWATGPLPDPERVWSRVRHAFRRAEPEPRRILLRLGMLPGSDQLVADALLDGDEAVHNSACGALQRRVRDAAAAADLGLVNPALAPLAKVSPRRPRSVRNTIATAIAAVAEAGRTGDVAFLDACKFAVLAVLRDIQRRTFLLRLVRSSIVRRGVIGVMVAAARAGFENVRSHNPMRRFSEVVAHFKSPRALRQQVLAPIIEFMARDQAQDASAATARDRLADLTRRAHEVPALAFAPANWVIESAWATLPLPSTDEDLAARIDVLATLFDDDLANDRGAYAQSCLFIMFRQLWSAPDILRDAAFAALPRYEALIVRWISKTQGAYVTAAGNPMRILHLFRQAGLSRRLRGNEGELFKTILGSSPVLAEALVEEVLHLAYELEEWPLAFELLGTMDASNRERGDHRVARAIQKAKREVAKRRPDIAHARAAAFHKLPSSAVEAAPAEPPPSLPPMTGISLAFEEMTYLLLRTSPPFRDRWTAWMRGCVEGMSATRWYASGFELAYQLTFPRAR